MRTGDPRLLKSFNFPFIQLYEKDIHPKFNIKTKATCACGATFEVGSTIPEIKMEICSHCHPFYTGNEKLWILPDG